jgi:hypothetical protein
VPSPLEAACSRSGACANDITETVPASNAAAEGCLNWSVTMTRNRAVHDRHRGATDQPSVQSRSSSTTIRIAPQKSRSPSSTISRSGSYAEGPSCRGTTTGLDMKGRRRRCRRAIAPAGPMRETPLFASAPHYRYVR